MEIITISSKYQIVIPKKVRLLLGLQPGQKLQAIPYQGRIELIPVEPVQELRGAAKGIDRVVKRDADRR